MTRPARSTSHGRRSRWAALLALSVGFHAAVLGGLSLGVAPTPGLRAEPAAMDVALVDRPPFVRPQLDRMKAAPPPQTKVVVLNQAPRYADAPVPAAIGGAADAVDLFGPVFADGQWPRPVVVASAPCDPNDRTERGQACRRDLMLIALASGGLASEDEARSNPRP